VSISDGLGGGKMVGGYKLPDAGWNYLVEVLGKCGHAALLGEVGSHRKAKELLQNAD
jgi:hypothetical protein